MLYSPIANAIKQSTDTAIKANMPKYIKMLLQGVGYMMPDTYWSYLTG